MDFRGHLDRLAPGPIGIAVSGGADSLALLLLANAARPGGIAAATVDHGLRPQARVEAMGVAAVCAKRGIPHTILSGTAEPAGQGIQAAARALRYRLLAEWALSEGLEAVATAHHRDDQAETLLMRASRGAGVVGLSGVRECGWWETGERKVRIVRPVLGWSRAALRQVVEQAGLLPVGDPANTDPAYDRTRFRALLHDTPAIDPAGLARAAAALADAAEALDWSLAALAAERIAGDGAALLIDPSGLPREYRRRLLAVGLSRFGKPPPRGPALDRLLATLEAGGTATLAGVRAFAGSRWRLVPAPPRRAH